MQAGHSDDPWREAAERPAPRAPSCECTALERALETGGLLAKWALDDYLSAVNALACAVLPRAEGDGGPPGRAR